MTENLDLIDKILRGQYLIYFMLYLYILLCADSKTYVAGVIR